MKCTARSSTSCKEFSGWYRYKDDTSLSNGNSHLRDCLRKLTERNSDLRQFSYWRISPSSETVRDFILLLDMSLHSGYLCIVYQQKSYTSNKSGKQGKDDRTISGVSPLISILKGNFMDLTG